MGEMSIGSRSAQLEDLDPHVQKPRGERQRPKDSLEETEPDAIVKIQNHSQIWMWAIKQHRGPGGEKGEKVNTYLT